MFEPRSSRVYHFGDELFFDVDASMLYTENKHVELAPMLSKLLQGFLEAEDYKLSIDEIMHLLWPGYDLIDSRVHTTVGRLRKCLSEVSDWQIVNNSSVYQLRKRLASISDYKYLYINVLYPFLTESNKV